MTKNNKPIFDVTPFTMLDYPNHLACIVWFAKCNMRCPYCYNPHIVLNQGVKSEEDLTAFLQNRIGRLEGVVLSGGECTLYSKIEDLCLNIKNLGFKIKIDTNGSNPQVLSRLLKLGLIDFVSLDFKAPKRIFQKITLSDFYEKTINSLRVLIENRADFEVRTTIHADLLSENDINEILDILSVEGYDKTYYLQNYLHAPKTLGDIAAATKSINKNRLSDKIKIEFRNF